MDVIIKLYRSSIILMLTWGLCNLTAASSFLFQKVNSKFELEMDDILAPFLSKVLRFIIIALSISVIAQEFNYDVNGLVAGLGLGGLAFALAAQDTVANFLEESSSLQRSLLQWATLWRRLVFLGLSRTLHFEVQSLEHLLKLS